MRDQAQARSLRDEPDLRGPARLRLVDDDEPAVRAAAAAPSERRTVVITGQPVPARRRSSRTATRLQARPDRIALWAVLLGVFLVFMAIATAHAGA